MNLESPRRKAFLGIALGAASLASSLIGGISARNRAKAERRQQELEQFKNANINAENYGRSMANVMDNQGYVDEMKERIVYRNGGRRQYTLGSNVQPANIQQPKGIGAGSVLSGAASLVDLGFGVANLLSPVGAKPELGVDVRDYHFQPKGAITKGVDDETINSFKHHPSQQLRMLHTLGGRRGYCKPYKALKI